MEFETPGICSAYARQQEGAAWPVVFCGIWPHAASVSEINASQVVVNSQVLVDLLTCNATRLESSTYMREPPLQKSVDWRSRHSIAGARAVPAIEPPHGPLQRLLDNCPAPRSNQRCTKGSPKSRPSSNLPKSERNISSELYGSDFGR